MTRLLPWRDPASDPRLRLLCLPFAGGSAVTYRSWIGALGDDVEVCPVELPGRATRFQEPPLASMDEMVAEVVDALGPLDDRPYALFGHSLGGQLAYAVDLALADGSGARRPLALFVSGAEVPGTVVAPRLSVLDDAAFRRAVLAMEGFSPEVAQHPELVDLMMDLVRVDIGAVEGWARPEVVSTDTPIVALGGDDDAVVPPTTLARWADLTSGSFRVESFPGGHFYLDTAGDQLLARLRDHLAGLGPPAAET